MNLPNYTAEALAGALLIAISIRHRVGEGDTSQAICGHWDDIEPEVCCEHGLRWRDLTAIRDGLYQSWPKYSGCPTYPVPACEDLYPAWMDSEQVDPDVGDAADAARFAYDNSDDKWVGDYGDLRRELLDYIIEQLQAVQ